MTDKRKFSSSRDSRDRDDRLMTLIAQGDGMAFETVVTTHLGRVVAVGSQMLGDRSAADDLAQDVMLKLWHHAKDWQSGRAKISTWLYRVTSNLAIDRIRANKTVQLDEDWDMAQQATQIHSLEEQHLQGRVNQALQQLSERQRLVLVLFHYQGLTMSETAEIMESSVDAVQSLLARSRAVMKKKLAKEWQSLLPDQIE